ncbi:MAG: hypothetical protein CMB76_05885 [Euryarchaeota archaeon]|jgi:hypothetical protein|nr:hypothetical protein [Euryarchaeota archaeon]|tara:strand:+ start:41 stop:250 length:210 start_codon:yes stop_codon:yes gene_type:complete
MTNRLDDKDEFRLALELNAEAMRILKTSLIEYMAAHDFNLPSKKKEGEMVFFMKEVLDKMLLEHALYQS